MRCEVQDPRSVWLLRNKQIERPKRSAELQFLYTFLVSPFTNQREGRRRVGGKWVTYNLGLRLCNWLTCKLFWRDILTHVSVCFAVYEEVHTSYMLTVYKLISFCCMSV